MAGRTEAFALRNLVVGVDGTDAAANALVWAADTVGACGTIHAVTAVSPATELVVDAALADSVAYRQLLERELREHWVGQACDRVGTLTTVAVEGTAADALMAHADEHDADAIVIGTHVGPRGLPKVTGSTIRHLLADLRRPMILVPPSRRAGLDGDGAVIVGIGYGDATGAAVDWAARVAAERGLALGLVRATDDAPVFRVDRMLEVFAYFVDPTKRAEWTLEDLEDMAARAQSATNREIVVGVAAVDGPPANELVEISTTASLLVIGLRPPTVPISRHVTQPLRYALTHARCPVAVVPIDRSSSADVHRG